MKKITVALCSALLLVLLSGCTGPRGAVYLKYSWYNTLEYFSDTNPAIPSTFYKNEYYSTEPGTYYLTYKISGYSTWYGYYTITAKEGGPFFEAGEDSKFEIYLGSSSPSLYSYKPAGSSLNNELNLGDATSSGLVIKKDYKLATGEKRSEILGTEVREYPNAIVKLEWGKILND